MIQGLQEFPQCTGIQGYSPGLKEQSHKSKKPLPRQISDHILPICGHRSFRSSCWKDSKLLAYDYPITNPLAATVVGTPQSYQADLPKKIPVKERELEVFT